jgi:hypothetical protein
VNREIAPHLGRNGGAVAVSVRATDHKSDVRATILQRAEGGVEEFLQALARAVQQFHT